MTDCIELIYDRTCPHVETARSRLRAALTEAGLGAVWREWERGAPGSPPYVQRWGSPTILVNGRDVAAPRGGSTALDGGAGCRVYAGTSGRLEGAPAVDTIVAALARRSRQEPSA